MQPLHMAEDGRHEGEDHVRSGHIDVDIKGQGMSTVDPSFCLTMGDSGPIRLVEIDVLPYTRRQMADVHPVAAYLSEDDRSELVGWHIGAMNEDVD